MICEKVPIFDLVKPPLPGDRQLYKYGTGYYILAGTAPGCGREFHGACCTSCRSFLPNPVDKPKAKSRRAPVADNGDDPTDRGLSR